MSEKLTRRGFLCASDLLACAAASGVAGSEAVAWPAYSGGQEH
jgi:hypothetical protein